MPQTPLYYCLTSKKGKELQLLIPVVLDASAGHSGLSQTTEKKDFILIFFTILFVEVGFLTAK